MKNKAEWLRISMALRDLQEVSDLVRGSWAAEKLQKAIEYLEERKVKLGV